MKDKGFIVLYRKFLEWEWWDDIKTCHLFLYCLLRANYQDTVWRGITIKKGQFITSLRTLSSETGLSLQNVRTSLKKLTQELTHESHSQYSIITVKNYTKYQKTNTQNNKQLTTDNNITNRTINKNSYINSSSSSSSNNNTLPKISEEEEEILKNHSLKNKVKYFQPWLRKVLANGDYKEILEKEKKRIERLKAKEKIAAAEKFEEGEKLSPEELARLAREQREKLRVINGGG